MADTMTSRQLRSPVLSIRDAMETQHGGYNDKQISCTGNEQKALFSCLQPRGGYCFPAGKKRKVLHYVPSHILFQIGAICCLKVELYAHRTFLRVSSLNSIQNLQIIMFEVKTSLGALSKKCCGYYIRLTRNGRICNARSGKVGSSHCYLDRRPLHELDEIVYEYDKKTFSTIGIRCIIKSNF